MLQLLSFLILVGVGGFIFLYHYLHLLAEFPQRGVLETPLYTQSTGKQLCRSLFLTSQYPATFLIKHCAAFLWILRNCQEHHFYKNTLKLLILYLWNISVTITYNLMLITQSGFSNHLRHS